MFMFIPEMAILSSGNYEFFHRVRAVAVAHQGNRITFWLSRCFLLHILAMALLGEHCHRVHVIHVCCCARGRICGSIFERQSLVQIQIIVFSSSLHPNTRTSILAKRWPKTNWRTPRVWRQFWTSRATGNIRHCFMGKRNKCGSIRVQIPKQILLLLQLLLGLLGY